MKSIQTKFIILLLGCVLFSSAIIGGAGIVKSRQVVDKDSAQIMNLLCSEKAKELDALLSRIEQSVRTLSVYTQEQLESLERLKTDPSYLEEYTQLLEQVAANAANNTEGALAVYVRFNPELAPPTSGLFWSRTEMSGRFQRLVPTDFSSYSPTDAEHVGWYYIPVKNGKATWMEPYLNQNINMQMISYVIPFYHNNETVGVVGMDIDFSVISESVNDTRVYQSGYAFLANTEGKVICHRGIPMGTPMESTDASLVQVVKEFENGTSGSNLFDYSWNKEEKRMAFRTLHNGMRLAVTAPVAEIDSEKNGLILQMLTALFCISILAVLLTVSFTRRLIRPLKELNEAAKKIANGDFTVSIGRQTRDEVGALAESFQKTAEYLQQYISYINSLAYRDALTGVKNKAAYQDAARRLESEMQTGRPAFALVVLDINGLKHINDTCGHDFGDMLIIDAARLICKSFKFSPVYRIGGDEFVVILEGVASEQFAELLEGFEAGIREHNSTARPDSFLAIARGIAVYSSETDLVFSNVFKRADDAMYKNKAATKEAEGLS